MAKSAKIAKKQLKKKARISKRAKPTKKVSRAKAALKALKAAVRPESPLTLDRAQRVSIQGAADALMNSLAWRRTWEGPEYWSRVYGRLCALARGEAL